MLGVRTTLAALARAGRPVSAGALETQVDLSRGRLEMMLKVLDVDGAVQRVSGGWQATGRDWVYDAERYERVAAERSREQQAMLGYLATGGCRMEYLRRELDDPAAAPCGRCDNCTGRRWSAAVSEAGTAAARDRLMRPGVDVAPRKMWPTGMKDLGVEVAGKIPATEAAATGRALGRLTDLGWGPRLRALLDASPAAGPGPAAGPAAEPAPDDLVAAMVKVLAAWDWEQRPAGVVTVPSRRRPQLIGSLGRQLAGIGQLPYLGALAYTWVASDGDDPGVPPPAPGPARHFNSAQRLRGVWQALALPADVAAAVEGAGGPVLLVDDQIDTGWTMTVAARLLRLAGAPAVLPFALAVTAG